VGRASHLFYAQAVFAVDRVMAMAPRHPEWKTTAPFSAVLSGNMAPLAALTENDWEEIVGVTHSEMRTEAFEAIAEQWMSTAKHPKIQALVYGPRLATDERMREVMDYRLQVYPVSCRFSPRPNRLQFLGDRHDTPAANTTAPPAYFGQGPSRRSNKTHSRVAVESVDELRVQELPQNRGLIHPSHRSAAVTEKKGSSDF
jgi:hypothetical protein